MLKSLVVGYFTGFTVTFYQQWAGNKPHIVVFIAYNISYRIGVGWIDVGKSFGFKIIAVKSLVITYP
jgi:hypothetical protein